LIINFRCLILYGNPAIAGVSYRVKSKEKHIYIYILYAYKTFSYRADTGQKVCNNTECNEIPQIPNNIEQILMLRKVFANMLKLLLYIL
jgi:hypothetical protein